MPGHIFYLLSASNTTEEYFHNSLLVDLNYQFKEQIDSINNWEGLHNLAYLVQVLAISGQRTNAMLNEVPFLLLLLL